MSIFIKGNVHGDVIEAGGVKNVTNNYHGEKLAENAEQAGVNEESAEKKMGRNGDKQDGETPKELQSNRARGMLGELVKERLLKDNWQPAEGVAEWQLAVIAHKIGEELEIVNFWQVFARLWDRKAGTLRSNYNTYLNREVEIKFRKRLAKIA